MDPVIVAAMISAAATLAAALLHRRYRRADVSADSAEPPRGSTATVPRPDKADRPPPLVIVNFKDGAIASVVLRFDVQITDVRKFVRKCGSQERLEKLLRDAVTSSTLAILEARTISEVRSSRADIESLIVESSQVRANELGCTIRKVNLMDIAESSGRRGQMLVRLNIGGGTPPVEFLR